MPELIFKDQVLYTSLLNSDGVEIAMYKGNTYIFNPLDQTYKLDPVLSLSVPSLEVFGHEGIKTFTFSYNGDGVISVASTDENVATVNLSNGVITVTYVSAGTSRIIVSASEGILYKSVYSELTVTCSKSTPTLTSVSNTTVDGATGLSIFSYTYTGDAQVTAASSNSSVATATCGEGTARVIYISAGTVTVTLTASETDKYLAVSKDVLVTCSRSPSTITLSSSSLSVLKGNSTGSFTFTYTGDGTLSVSSSNTSIVTVSRNGTTVTVTYKATGSAIVTVSISDGTVYAASSKNCSVTCKDSVTWYLQLGSVTYTFVTPLGSTFRECVGIRSNIISDGTSCRIISYPNYGAFEWLDSTGKRTGIDAFRNAGYVQYDYSYVPTDGAIYY